MELSDMKWEKKREKRERANTIKTCWGGKKPWGGMCLTDWAWVGWCGGGRGVCVCVCVCRNNNTRWHGWVGMSLTSQTNKADAIIYCWLPVSTSPLLILFLPFPSAFCSASLPVSIAFIGLGIGEGGAQMAHCHEGGTKGLIHHTVESYERNKSE
jgi:hypothetical protein